MDLTYGGMQLHLDLDGRGALLLSFVLLLTETRTQGIND